MKYKSFTLVALMVMGLSTAFASNEVTNDAALRQKLGTEAYPSGTSIQNFKVAILDNGFAGYEPGKGMLPASAQIVPGPLNPPEPTPHGLGMAEILWSVLGRPVLGPKFYLINTNGYTNLAAAVQFVIDNKIDLVLYSEVWAFGDNFDGKGFINALVNRATSAGTIWVNAAGNYGGMSYTGAVVPQRDRGTGFETVNGTDHLRFTNQLDQNNVTITLSWTDFADDEHYNAVKDLDLFLYDPSGNLVGSSELVQNGHAPPATGTSSLSSFAREVITLPQLDRGEYWIKVKAKSDNFVPTDQFRVIVDTDKPGSVTFTDHSVGGEVMPPADNPNVITVGEATPMSSVGPFVAGHAKPDALIDDATVTFSNGDSTQGSSNAAALVAGAVVALKATRPQLDSAHLFKYLSGLQRPSATADLTAISPAQVSPWIQRFAPPGSQVMLHKNGHFVVLTPMPPLQTSVFQNAHAYLQSPDDILVISPVDNHWYAVHPQNAAQILPPVIEFRQMTSATAGYWVTPTPAQLAALLAH